jgi:hypothetical protein
MTLKFNGLFEPHEIPTGDRRMFKAMSLTNRDLPLPLMMRSSSGGHGGAEIVGEITEIKAGPKGRWYSGTFLDPKHAPAVTRAIYLAKKKMVGPSVDLDRSFTVEPRPHTDGRPMAYFTSGNVIGVTLVPMPAFADVTFTVEGELEVEGEPEEMKVLTAALDQMDADSWAEFAVTGARWDALPIAPRDYVFDADDAVKRIAFWSGVGTQGADVGKYASMFLWRGGNQTGPSLAQEDFRLPIGDIIQGQPMLVFHAIYAAAALLSGAHGGLPNIPESEKSALKGVINQIYPKMAAAFGDESMHSPFVPGQQEGGQQMSQPTEEFAEKTEPYGDVAYADPGYRDNKKRYPIDTPEHIRAAWSYINVASNAAEYTAEQLAAIKSKIKAAMEKAGIGSDTEMAITLPMTEFAMKATAPPSKVSFDDPKLPGPTPLTVTDDGRIFGHLGLWGQCHVGIGDRCVMLPKTRTDYALFLSGTVKTLEGVDVKVGKITLGTGHAHPQYGIVPARDHYDNSGWCAAVVRPHQDRFGIAVAGVVTDMSKVDELRRSPLSGDWRRYNGNLELVAALAVNNPGFPVFHMAESEEFSLVAAGVVGMPEARDLSVLPPMSLNMIVDVEQIEREVRENLTAAAERRQRMERITVTRETREQAARAARLRKLMGEGLTAAAPSPAPQPQAPTSQPATSSQPASQPAGQDVNGDGIVDPEADPTSPGIAEFDDPGRETMLARQRDAQYTIVPESDTEATETETETEVVPDKQAAAPAPQATPPPAPQEY